MPKILVAVTEKRLTAAAASWIEVALFDGALAMDATVGNGYDALFLAHRVGPKGKVLGFDVQKAALAGAREILKFVGSIDRVSLIHDSHARLADYLPAGSEPLQARCLIWVICRAAIAKLSRRPTPRSWPCAPFLSIWPNAGA